MSADEIKLAGMALLGAALPARDFIKQHEPQLWRCIERLAYHHGFDFREPSPILDRPPLREDPDGAEERRGSDLDANHLRDALAEVVNELAPYSAFGPMTERAERARGMLSSILARLPALDRR